MTIKKKKRKTSMNYMWLASDDWLFNNMTVNKNKIKQQVMNYMW